MIIKAYGSSGPTVHSLYCDVKCRIAGFQSRDTRLALGGQLQMETGIDLVFGITYIHRFHKAQSGNMCKVDHQALSYVNV